MEQVHLVYQAYGTESVRRQALYAAYSALAFKEHLPLTIHMYTDRPADYGVLAGKLAIHKLSPALIRAWRGPFDFTHRLKIMMLRDIMDRNPDEKILYADGDTLFYQPFGHLFSSIGIRSAVMHCFEYPAATYPSRQMRQFRARLKRVAQAQGTQGTGGLRLDGGMWNAGAIGLHPRHAIHVDQMLDSIDKLYPACEMGLVEQYAVSYHLQKSLRLTACDDVLYHYWGDKALYDRRLPDVLEALAAMPLEKALKVVRQAPMRLQSPRPSFVRRLANVLADPPKYAERLRLRRSKVGNAAGSDAVKPAC